MWSMQQWGGLAAFALVFLFLFLVVIGPDFLYPAMGLPAPSRTPPDLATRLANIKHPAQYIQDGATLLFGLTAILLMAGVHDRLRVGGPDLSRLALAAGFIGGALGVAGAMISYSSRSALAAIEDRTAAEAAVTTTEAIGRGLALGGAFMFGLALVSAASAGLLHGGLPQPLSWLLLADGAIFVLYPVIAPFGPSYGGLTGLLIGGAAPAITLVGVVWLGIVLWRG
jgi:hypothetical protein